MDTGEALMLNEIATPSFVVNRLQVAANCQQMLNYCKARNISLRPHMKTHKCVEVARMMTEGVQHRQVTVSTLAEAEMLAINGFTDILFAHYAVDNSRINRLHALIDAPSNVNIHLFVDSDTGLSILEKNPPPNGKKWSIYLKVDCGYGRGGALYDAESTLKLAEKIAHGPCTVLHGIYAHDGDSYYAKRPGEAVEVGRITGHRLCDLANKINYPNLVVAIGATPSCLSYSLCNFELPSGINELHPGAYCFCDTQQQGIGACSEENIACYVATRVVGHYPEKGHLLVDAGFTALSHDLGRVEINGDGSEDCILPRLSVRIVGHPELAMTRVTQEIGFIRAINPSKKPLDYMKYPVGSMLFIQPYHCCATADKHNVYYITDDNIHVADKWVPCKGW